MRIGRSWFVSQTSLQEFIDAQEAKKHETRSTLSKTRNEEYRTAQANSANDSHSTNIRKVSQHEPFRFTNFQKQQLAILAALVVMLTGVYGAQAATVREIGQSALETSLAFANGFDDLLENAAQNAMGQAHTQMRLAQMMQGKTSTASENENVNVALSENSQRFAQAIQPLAMAPPDSSVHLASTEINTTFPTAFAQQAPSAVSGSEISSPLAILGSEIPTLSDVADVVGSAGLNLGVTIRDAGMALPGVLAREELGSAIAFSEFSDEILINYSNGVYAWVNYSPEVPEAIVETLYNGGSRAEYAIASAPRLAVATFNVGVNEIAIVPTQIAESLLNQELAFGTALNSIPNSIVAIEVKSEEIAGFIAYTTFSHGETTVTQTPLAVVNLENSIEDLALTFAGNTTIASEQAPHALGQSSSSLAAAIVPEEAYWFFEQVALGASDAFNTALSGVNYLLALGGSTNHNQIAVEPNLYVIPPTGSAKSGWTLPAGTVANSTAGITNSNVASNITNETIIEQGASEEYVDDSINALRNQMFEEFDAFSNSLNQNYGNGGTTIIENNSGGGTTLASSSDISIDGVTANTGVFGSLTVTGTSTLNTLTAGTSTFNGNVTINGTLTATNITGFGGGGTTVGPYFTATDTNATSSFAGNVSVAGNTSLATTSITNLSATNITGTNATITNATTTNFFSALVQATTGIFSNLIATIANITNLNVTNSTTTNATSTNFFATNGGFTNLIADIANFTSAIIGNLTATNLTATNATTTNATSTNLFVTNLVGTNATTTSLFTSNLTIGSLNGLLKSTNGVVTSATAGTDYLAPNSLSATYPLQYAGDVFSLAFGTTTSNTWGGTQTFTTPPVLGTLTGLVGSNNGSLYQIATSSNFVTSLSGTANEINVSTATGAVTLSLPSTVNLQNASTSNISANTLAVGGTGTTTISSTGALTTPSLTVGSLNGFLKATAGAISTSLINLTTDVTGTLPVANGGTGWGSVASGSLLYGNGSSALATTSAGVAGQVLALLNGIPTWTSTTTFTGGTGISTAYSNGQVTVTNTGVTSLAQTYGTNQTGAVSLATSSASFNGLTFGQNITNTGSTFTFTPTVSGTLGVAGGGTGANSFTTSQLLYGAGSGALQSVATSSVSNGTGISISGNAALVGSGGITITNTGVTSIAGTANEINASASSGAVTISLPSQLSLSNASTTNLSANTLAVGGTGTTTISSTGALTTPSLSIGSLSGILYANNGVVNSAASSTIFGTGTGGQILTWNNGVPAWVASTTYASGTGISTSFTSGQLTISNTGVTSLTQNGGGTAQTGALTLSTSSQTLNGITYADKITNSGGTFTFTPNVSGTLTVAGGGTGQTTFTSSQLLYGNGTNGLTSVATSSLAVSGPFSVSGTLGALVGGTNATITYTGLATTSQPSSSNILVSNGTNGVYGVATSSLAVSGAFSYSGTLGALVGGAGGTLSLANNGVALTNLAQIGANTVLVNNTGATGNVVAIATSTFGSTLFGVGTNGTTLAEVGGVPTWVATTTFSSGLSYSAGNVTNTGVLSLTQNGGGTAQTGALTLSTSSQTLNGITYADKITNSGGTFTFTPNVSGTLTVAGGGTGQTTFTGGQLLYGNGTNALSSVATGTVSSGTGISVTAGQYVIGSGLTITNTGVTSLAGTANQITASASTGGVTLSIPSLFAIQQASTTELSVTGPLFVGTTATTTISGTATSTFGAGVSTNALADTGLSSGNLVGSGAGGYLTGITVGSGLTLTGGTLATNGSGITAIGPTGQTQTGGTQILASSTSTTNGLTSAITIVGNSNTLTFTPSLSGTLTVAGGGTGQTTLSSSQLLYGAGTGAVQSVATSTVSNGTGISISGSAAVVGAGGLTITNTGVTSAAQTYGTNQTGALTFATSSATTFNGLTISNSITNSGGTFTFAPNTITGTLGVAGGGTGATSFTSGNLLYGSGTGTVQNVATSSLSVTGPLSYSGTLGSLVGGIGGTLSLGTVGIGNGGTGTTTGGISGGVEYYNGSIITNTAGFVYNGTNLGIGTTSPYAPLSVLGQVVATNFFGTSTTATSTFAGGLLVGSNSLTVLQNGNIGIGNTTPGTKLDITGTARVSSTLTLSSIASCTGNEALQTDGSGDIACGAISVSGASSGGGWTTNNINAVGLSTTTYQVAIGATTTPYAKLTVLSGNAATTTLALLPSSGQTADILDIYNGAGNLDTVINSSNFLGIGTTSPTQRLSVQGGGIFSGNITLAGLTATGTATVGNLVNNGVTANTLLYANTGNQESSATVNSPLSFSAGALSLGTVGITNGGTGTTTGGVSGGVSYYNGSIITNTAGFVYNGTNLGVGTTSPATTLGIQGNALFSGNVLAANVTATGTLTVGTLNGPLQANNGVVSATTSIGVLYGGTGLTSAPAYGNILVGNSSGGYTLTATSSLGLITSAIQNLGPTGQLQSGSTVTIASSTSTTNGLTSAITIVGNSNTLTFTPSLSGTLGVAGGGTGWRFVKLETNQGIVGWGEGTLEGKAQSAMSCIRGLS